MLLHRPDRFKTECFGVDRLRYRIAVALYRRLGRRTGELIMETKFHWRNSSTPFNLPPLLPELGEGMAQQQSAALAGAPLVAGRRPQVARCALRDHQTMSTRLESPKA